jgi:hypothetical protein
MNDSTMLIDPAAEEVTLLESSGTVALPTSEVGRFALFTISLAALRQPNNSVLSIYASASVTANLNQAARGMLEHEDHHEWLFILGDDHAFQNDTLMTMLKVMDDHPEIDILVPLVVNRNPPWHIGLFHASDERLADGTPLFKVMGWEEVPMDRDVFPVDAAGNAGMLMRRHVVEAMAGDGEPLFYSTVDSKGRGVILNEDLTFCVRAQEEHGFTLYATTKAWLGHLGVYNVRPLQRDGRWGALTEFSSPEASLREVFMPVDVEAGNVLDI